MKPPRASSVVRGDKPRGSSALLLAFAVTSAVLLATTLLLSVHVDGLGGSHGLRTHAVSAPLLPPAGDAAPPPPPSRGVDVAAALRRAGIFRADRAAAPPPPSTDAAYARLAAAVAYAPGAYPSAGCADRVRRWEDAAAVRRGSATLPGDGAPAPRAWKALPADVAKRDAVVAAMRHAWSAYEQHAWGHDELDPLARAGKDGFGSLGASILDSLDTLYLMGLQPEFERARTWVVTNLTFDKPRAVESWDKNVEMHVSFFETTIRAVGGLLAAGSLAGDAALVRKAADIAERLLPAFDTGTGVPLGWVQLFERRVRHAEHAILSEYATISLEFLTLSALTGDARFGALAEGALVAALQSAGRPTERSRGFMLTLLEPHHGAGFANGRVSFGGAGDSAYEYWLKTWLLGGKRAAFLPYRHLFDAAADSLAAQLTRRSGADGLLYIAEQVAAGQVVEHMEHLACFMAGTLVMAAEGARAERYMGFAEELAETCFQMYAKQASGLAPDIAQFAGGAMTAQDAHWQLRPETIESLFYLYRATGDEVYRQRGWAIFQAVERHCRVAGGGFAGIRDVTSPHVAPGAAGAPPVATFAAGALDGTQPSWFLAETLKYFWLLFADSSALDLNEWVLNTEAHPLRVPPASHLRGSLLAAVPPEQLVPGAPLPRGLRAADAAAAAASPLLAHDTPGKEEDWVTAAWRDALAQRKFVRGGG